MNSLRIDITNLLKNGRPNSINARILVDASNTTLIPSSNTLGVIHYEEIGIFVPKSKSAGGLSGGAIAAIVIASVVAILAVLFLIYFFNRSIVPSVESTDVKNIPNSSTNINN